MFNVFATYNLCFFHAYYIFNSEYPKKLEVTFFTNSEAATGGVLWKKVFYQILQNSQKNTCARNYFLIKLQAYVKPPEVFCEKRCYIKFRQLY